MQQEDSALQVQLKRKNNTYSDAYDMYLKDCGRLGEDPVSKKRYREIIDEYTRLIIDQVLNKGLAFRMPFGLGWFLAVKKRNNRSKTDILHSMQTGTKVLYNNKHTNSYVYGLVWQPKEHRSSKSGLSKDNKVWTKYYMIQFNRRHWKWPFYHCIMAGKDYETV